MSDRFQIASGGGVLRSIRVVLAFLILAALLGAVGGAQAQSEDDIWSEPVNLSRSGAASQPRIVAVPDGRLQVFWWDRFDGLTTSRFDGEAWSDPASAPILMTELEGEEVVVSAAVEKTPYIVADARGWAHAFWLGRADEETEATPLMYSRMPVGGTSWSEPDTLAESAVAFDVAEAPDGGLTLAYMRTLHTDAFPAGVYIKRMAGGGAEWGSPSVVYETIYFRLLTAENTHVRVSDSGDGTIQLAWDQPYLEQALYARSTDGGTTWSTPEPLGEPDDRPARPRVLALSGGSGLRLWEAAGMSGCVLYQQRLIATETVTPTWSAPQQVLEGVNPCPRGERSWLHDEGLLWLWGEGTSTLTLAAWDAEMGRWSEPRGLDFRFQDLETEGWVGLSGLRIALVGDVLAVAGSDLTAGEVWVTVAQVGALELAFAPPLPWSEPVRLSQEGVGAGWPAVALDAQGNAHVVWSQPSTGSGPGTALLYARQDGATGRWSRAAEVVLGASGEEMARQPALVADAQGLLHLVWSGGDQGQVFYSRAKVSEATGSGGWSSPRPLSPPGLSGSWPQIAMDVAGCLYVVYAVPLNEGRGIYLTRSDDGGETWSEPEAVFDAAAEGWGMVGHPVLAMASDRTLHVAWVRGALPETWPPQGIYYARSDDGGSSWAEPWEVAGAGYDWPRLALAEERVHLLYTGAGGGDVWHRWSYAGGSGWRTATRVSGLGQAGSPLGVVADAGGALHLVGVGAGGGALLYSTWDGERWGSAELLSLRLDVEAGLGVAAATWLQSGRLAVALRVLEAGESGEETSVLLYTERTISPAGVPPAPTISPSPTPVATQGPTLQPTAVPSPTPDLTGGPEPSGSSQLPLFLGGGLAAVIVVGVLVTWGVWRGRR